MVLRSSLASGPTRVLAYVLSGTELREMAAVVPRFAVICSHAIQFERLFNTWSDTG